MAPEGRFMTAWRAGTAEHVGMQEVKCQVFSDSSINSIGTTDLNSCSAVVIASPMAAILAHIAPLPDPNSLHGDPRAGDLNCQSIMNKVVELYRQAYSSGYFTVANKEAFSVMAVYRGNVALPDQKHIIVQSLEAMGLSCREHHYTVGQPSHGAVTGKGTVYVVGAGGKLEVYVEDALVYQYAPPQAQDPWVWDEEYRQYRYWDSTQNKWVWRQDA